MLEFKLDTSKTIIGAKESARIKFTLKNISDKVIHCLSYKFKTFWSGKVVDDFNPHEFFFNLDPNEEKEKEFGEVNISEAYLAGNTNPGDYEIKVWIRYFICGEEEIRQVSSSKIISLINEAQYAEL